MVNPAGKAPSKTKLRKELSQAEFIQEFTPRLTKIHSGFNKLKPKDKHAMAVKKNLQQWYPDEEDYSDKTIRKEILSKLGVASGKYDSNRAVSAPTYGKSGGRSERQLSSEKKSMPAGYAHGGRIHRGRKAMRGSD